MQYSTNYEMNKPERADQYNINHWNANTDIIDTQLKANADAVSDETTRATGAENNVDAFNDVLIVSGGISEQKTVTLPARFRNGVCCKFIFPNGHNCADSSTYLTLNDANNNRIPIVVNKHGILENIPIHTMTEGGSTVYKCLQANIVLEMYYTNNYDGNNNSAFVVIGNPVVLSSNDYMIYANGKIGNDDVGTVKIWSLWTIPYGWQECNGQAISRTTYKELYDKFRTQYVNGSSGTTLLTRYGTGDGSTTFNLPDYQESALVGVGTNIKDANTIGANYHDTYNLGQFKNDQLQNHEHYLWTDRNDQADYHGRGDISGHIGNNYFVREQRNEEWIQGVRTDKLNARTGTVTRGKRKGVKYIIKVL